MSESIQEHAKTTSSGKAPGYCCNQEGPTVIKDKRVGTGAWPKFGDGSSYAVGTQVLRKSADLPARLTWIGSLSNGAAPADGREAPVPSLTCHQRPTSATQPQKEIARTRPCKGWPGHWQSLGILCSWYTNHRPTWGTCLALLQAVKHNPSNKSSLAAQASAGKAVLPTLSSLAPIQG